MHSTSADPRRGLRTLVGAIALAAAGALQAQDTSAVAPAASGVAGAAPAAAPSSSSSSSREAAIQAAVDALRADPLLSGKEKTHTLQWIDADEERRKPPRPWAWLVDFIRFLNDTSRILLYGLIAALVAALLVGARRFVHLRSFRRRGAAERAVSHVRDLDVRPESLPDDIGATAWALWRAGRVPAALSLLYRGALSRLIHRHAVSITAATTEGECLELARGHIDGAAHRYLTQVVRAWEATIYGNRTLSDAMGEALCTGFAPRLDGASSASAGAGESSP